MSKHREKKQLKIHYDVDMTLVDPFPGFFKLFLEPISAIVEKTEEEVWNKGKELLIYSPTAHVEILGLNKNKKDIKTIIKSLENWLDEGHATYEDMIEYVAQIEQLDQGHLSHVIVTYGHDRYQRRKVNGIIKKLGKSFFQTVSVVGEEKGIYFSKHPALEDEIHVFLDDSEKQLESVRLKAPDVYCVQMLRNCGAKSRFAHDHVTNLIEFLEIIKRLA